LFRASDNEVKGNNLQIRIAHTFDNIIANVYGVLALFPYSNSGRNDPGYLGVRG
jgi:hypothetical protein